MYFKRSRLQRRHVLLSAVLKILKCSPRINSLRSRGRGGGGGIEVHFSGISAVLEGNVEDPGRVTIEPRTSAVRPLENPSATSSPVRWSLLLLVFFSIFTPAAKRILCLALSEFG